MTKHMQKKHFCLWFAGADFWDRNRLLIICPSSYACQKQTCFVLICLFFEDAAERAASETCCTCYHKHCKHVASLPLGSRVTVQASLLAFFSPHLLDILYLYVKPLWCSLNVNLRRKKMLDSRNFQNQAEIPTYSTVGDGKGQIDSKDPLC